jgi:hypothetical protein
VWLPSTFIQTQPNRISGMLLTWNPLKMKNATQNYFPEEDDQPMNFSDPYLFFKTIKQISI